MDKKKQRKESRAHDKSARKTFRKDHPSLIGRVRLKFGRSYNRKKK